MNVAETDRLIIRNLALSDAEFFRRQVNEPSWIANIGDRCVRSSADAERYIQTKTLASYAKHGFGMYLLELKGSGAPIGVCGLVMRDALPDPDIGFALLEDQWGRGYAEEAARAVVRYGVLQLGLERILGITTLANERSGKLLEKLGFKPQGPIQLSGEDLRLYAFAAQPGVSP